MAMKFLPTEQGRAGCTLWIRSVPCEPAGQRRRSTPSSPLPDRLSAGPPCEPALSTRDVSVYFATCLSRDLPISRLAYFETWGA